MTTTPTKAQAKRRKSRLATLFDTVRARGWNPGKFAGWTDSTLNRNYDIIAVVRLKAENMTLAAVAIEILSDRKPDTVRGIMYALVSVGWLPDTDDTSYDRIQRLLNALRKKGIVPYEWIVDNVRESIKPSSWSGLEDFADTVRDAYRRDFWSGLPEYVEIIVEKDTVAGRIEPVTRAYDVRLSPLRGYSSTSFAWSIAQSWTGITKPITVYYIGDHDPSGRDIERSIVRSLKEHVEQDFSWHRLAVNPEQFKTFKILPLAPKKKDSRYRRFADEFGDDCAEVEAIPADALRNMVKGAILQHIPADQWRRLQAIETEEKTQWAKFIDGLKGAA